MKTETALDPRVEETRATNEEIERLMASLPPTYTIPPAETRKARAEGKGLLPLPPRLDDIATVRTIPGRAGDIGLRVFVPETVTGAVLHIHGGGWTFGAPHRYTPSSTFSMSTSTSTSPRGTHPCSTPRRRYTGAGPSAARAWSICSGSDDRPAPAYAAVAASSLGSSPTVSTPSFLICDALSASTSAIFVEAGDQAWWEPHTRVIPTQLDGVTLRPEQLLVINCPGNISPGAIVRVRDFVAAGGSLFTTDWALRNVIEPAFANTVAYNERATADDVVRIEIGEPDNPFLVGVIDPGEEPLWWLEGSSYPIRVLDAARVKVLVRSSELEGKCGEAPVAVLFDYGHGEVFHMISHYYLQRTELRGARHKSSAASYAAAKGVDILNVEIDDLVAGERRVRGVIGASADQRHRSKEAQAELRHHCPWPTLESKDFLPAMKDRDCETTVESPEERASDESQGQGPGCSKRQHS